MPELFIYLIKVNIVLVLFYLTYRFLLRPLTFYTLNRIFLVFGIVFSTAYPFVDLSSLFEKNREFISPQLVNAIPDWQPGVMPAAIVQNNAGLVAESFNYWIIPQAIFWIGVLIMSLRLIIQFISLYRLHKRSVAQASGEHIYRDVSESVNPFSFLRNIYLNSSQLSAKELGSVLEHEKVHTKEWHTLDVLLSELNIVFYWFNPGAWLMKKAVKENLEFIADYKILQQGTDSIAYQYDLLNVSLLKQSSPLVNHFSLLTLKRRIIMMNKQRSSPTQISRYLLTLPLVILLALVFTVSKAQYEKSGSPAHPSVRLNHEPKDSPSVKRTITVKTIYSARQAVSAISKAITTLSETVMQNDIIPASAIHESQDSAKYLINGKPAWHIVDGRPVSDLGAIPANLRAFSYHLKGEAAMRIFGPEYSKGVVLVITRTNKNSEPVSELLQKIDPDSDAYYRMEYDLSGNAVVSYFKPLNIQSNDIPLRGDLIIPSTSFTSGYPLIRSDGSGFDFINNTGNALYFINGKEATKEQADKLTPQQLEHIYIAYTNSTSTMVEWSLMGWGAPLQKFSNYQEPMLAVRNVSIPYTLTNIEKIRAAVIIIKKEEQKK